MRQHAYHSESELGMERLAVGRYERMMPLLTRQHTYRSSQNGWWEEFVG